MNPYAQLVTAEEAAIFGSPYADIREVTATRKSQRRRWYKRAEGESKPSQQPASDDQEPRKQ